MSDDIKKICQLEDINITDFIKAGEFDDSPENINMLKDILSSYLQEELNNYKQLLVLNKRQDQISAKIKFLKKLLSKYNSLGGVDVPNK